MPLDEERRANLANWNDRVPIHAKSDDYDLAAFADPAHCSGVVTRDAPHLGPLDGLDVVHLQCHIGTDTISLARLGARSVVGLDFSGDALDVARTLASEHGHAGTVRFVEAELYDALAVLEPGSFDLVYTGVGAIVWLPDIAGWARIVAGLLRPGGRLYLRDGHPMALTIDETRDDRQLVVRWPYFESAGPQRWDDATTYTDGDGRLSHTTNYWWGHGLGETVQAVIDAGLVVTRLAEHREMEWRGLPWMVEAGGGLHVLPDGNDHLPLMFTLEARRPGG